MSWPRNLTDYWFWLKASFTHRSSLPKNSQKATSFSYYESNHNIVYSCKYYIVWCPKYRRKVLVDEVGLIYNHCIVFHKRYYKLYGKYLDKNNLQKHLVKLKKQKKFAYIGEFWSQAVQDVTNRIDRMYNLFWSNLKTQEEKFPAEIQKGTQIQIIHVETIRLEIGRGKGKMSILEWMRIRSR